MTKQQKENSTYWKNKTTTKYKLTKWQDNKMARHQNSKTKN